MQEYTFERSLIPDRAGIGLRAEHYLDVLETQPKIAWFEIHSENYFGDNCKAHYYLEQIRRDYPLSFHGVGLSLGSVDELNSNHLRQLQKLINRFVPALVSEHLSWSSIGGHFLHDLLPLPYTDESLQWIISKIHQVQDYLKQQILIENISSYIEFTHSIIPEYEFLAEIARQTGCGILLDVNNLYVNSENHGWNAKVYFQNIPVPYVKEIHLAGFIENQFDEGSILIDSHSTPIAQEVWELYSQVIQHFGSIPTLIERDEEIPPLHVLIQEAKNADRILDEKNVTPV